MAGVSRSTSATSTSRIFTSWRTTLRCRPGLAAGRAGSNWSCHILQEPGLDLQDTAAQTEAEGRRSCALSDVNAYGRRHRRRASRSPLLASQRACGRARKVVGVMAVTWRKAQEKAAVLAKPQSAATRATGSPRARRSMACTTRARCRQALKVSPVSRGNRRSEGTDGGSLRARPARPRPAGCRGRPAPDRPTPPRDLRRRAAAGKVGGVGRLGQLVEH